MYVCVCICVCAHAGPPLRLSHTVLTSPAGDTSCLGSSPTDGADPPVQVIGRGTPSSTQPAACEAPPAAHGAHHQAGGKKDVPTTIY